MIAGILLTLGLQAIGLLVLAIWHVREMKGVLP